MLSIRLFGCPGESSLPGGRVTIGTPSVGANPPQRADLSARARALITDGTWGTCLDRIEQRVTIIEAPTSSPALMAAHWNVFIVSCVPYPSQLASPNASALRRLQAAVSRLLPTRGWLRAAVLPACGALLDVPGAPKCPKTVAHAASIMAHLRDGGWALPA